MNNSTDLYTLYGAEFSLYSGKLRSYLRKKPISFTETHPSILTYKRFIVPRTGVRFIPVLQTPDDEVLQDTTVIIDTLEQRYPANSVYPETPRQKMAALLLELFGDEWLLNPAMHYRWHYSTENHSFLYAEFGRLLFPWLPAFLQKLLGKRIGDRFRGLLPNLGITAETWQALETWFESLLGDMEQHFGTHQFLLGGRPTMADFGFIGPLYSHIYRDPWSGKMLRERFPGVTGWVERMISDEVYDAPLLMADEISASLMSILQKMAVEQLPVLQDTALKIAAWSEGGENQELPRKLGMHGVLINGISTKRVLLPYSVWMFQRPLDYYFSLEGADRDAVAGMLDEMGARPFFAEPLKIRLVRRDNRLFLDLPD